MSENARRFGNLGSPARRVMPNSTLTGEANLLVFPNLDAANITLGVVKSMMDGLHVGPMLLGSAQPAHILSPSVTRAAW